MNRARERESCRGIVGTIVGQLGRGEGDVRDMVADLARAVTKLTDISEEQDVELDELREQLGAA